MATITYTSRLPEIAPSADLLKQLVKKNFTYIGWVNDPQENVVYVANPLSRSRNNKIVLRDFSNQNNRTLWNMMRAAKKEAKYQGPYSDAVRDILVQGFLQGRIYYPENSATTLNSVPQELQKQAWDITTQKYSISIEDVREMLVDIPCFDVVTYHHADTEEDILPFEERNATMQDLTTATSGGESSSSSVLPTSSSGTKRSSTQAGFKQDDDIYRITRKKWRQHLESDARVPIPGVQLTEHFRDTAAIYNIGMNHLNKENGTQNIVSHLSSIQYTESKVIEQLYRIYGSFRLFPTYFCIMTRTGDAQAQQASEGPLIVADDPTSSLSTVKDKGKEKVKEKEVEEEQKPLPMQEEVSLDDDENIVGIFAGEDGQGEKFDITRSTDAKKMVSMINEEIQNGVGEQQLQGSGWKWKRSLRMEFRMVVRPVAEKFSEAPSTEELDTLTRQRNQLPLFDPAAASGSQNVSSNMHFPPTAPPSQPPTPSSMHPVGSKYIPLPKWLRSKKCIINPENKEDDKCFAYALLRAIHHCTPPKGKYMHCSQAKIDDLIPRIGEIILPPKVTYPFKAKNRIFEAIETANRHQCTFSVFFIGQELGHVEVMYLTQWRYRTGSVPHFRLGLIESTGDVTNAHYVWIYSWNTLMRHKTSDRHNNIEKIKLKDFCERCFTAVSEDKMMKHEEYCRGNKAAEVVMPQRGVLGQHILAFHGNHWRYRVPKPFVIYADFEALLAPSETASDRISNEHVVSGWAYVISTPYEKLAQHIPANDHRKISFPREYFGTDAMSKFFASLRQDHARISNIVESMRQREVPILKGSEKLHYEGATHCWICEKPLLNGDKVLDHCHFTGKYRGPAHSYCNLKATDLTGGEYELPVFFHNFRGYDSYHLIKAIGSFWKNMKISCLAKSLFKFSTISIGTTFKRSDQLFKFVDSASFLQASLEKNTRMLLDSCQNEGDIRNHFKLMVEFYEEVYGFSMDEMKMLFAKGIYPYEYVDSWEKLETTELPPIECFTSKLGGGKRILQEEFQRAHEAWKLFNCKTLLDYTREYCILDVLLLACTFNRFRETSMDRNTFGIDPAHFISAPSLTWHAMLLRNETKHDPPVHIETLLDPSMLLMVEKGIRGGLCQVMIPHMKANYPEMKSPLMEDEDTFQYNPEENNRIILYLDANNLYGWAMSQFLPLDDFEWIFDRDLCDIGQGEDLHDTGIFDDSESTKLWLQEFVESKDDETTETGYLFEVDLEYPPELHYLHCDYPMAPSNRACDECSPFTKFMARQLGGEELEERVGHPKQKKLVLDFCPKERYVVHYKLLEFYLSHGMKLTQVWKVMRFHQVPWLKGYVDYNTVKRTEAKKRKDSVASEFHKICVNGLYGKTIENVRTRRNVEFIRGVDKEKEKRLNHYLLKRFEIIENDELLVAEIGKTKVIMDKPVIVGMSILELSKLNMYRFHYDIMLKNFPPVAAGKCEPRARMLYTDTDSLVYCISQKPGDEDPNSLWKELYWIQKNNTCFDLSENIDPKHAWLQDWGAGPIDRNVGAKQLGLMKNDMAFNPIEFIGLRSKMYSLLQDTTGLSDEYIQEHVKSNSEPGKIEKSKKKGIPQSIKISHRVYRKAFEGEKIEPVEFYKIGHDKTMQLQTQKEKKESIVACDDKSFWISNTMGFRYGHVEIGVWKSHMEELELGNQQY